MPEPDPDSQTESLHTTVDSLISGLLPEVIATRHHLHQNPELSHQELQTAALVAAKLRSLALDEVQTGVGGHGVVGTLHGTMPGPVFALRADMDALPIQETREIPYRSCQPGIMHACGHDGHTATLLGAAATLVQLREKLKGTVKFIFQPAEETVGGATEMCAEGVMSGVEAILALHGWPGLEVGKIAVRSGPMMASADSFDVTVIGKGGHAAQPHLGVDPIVVAAHLVTLFQTFSSREISPVEPVVVTVAQFHAGTAYNVIPGSAEIKGTVRCLRPELRKEMPERIERLVAGCCMAMRAEYKFGYRFGTPVTINDAGINALISDVGREQLGQDHVISLDSPSMGAEDFAVYLEHAPGAMFRLGVGAEMSALHTPTYDFGDEALPYGVSLFTHAALRYFDERKEGDGKKGV